MIATALNNIKGIWLKFWFNNVDYDQVAFFRMMFGAVMLGYYISRVPDLALFYTDEGLLPRSYIPSHEYLRGHFSLLIFTNSLTLIQLVHSLFLICLLLLTLGVRTRIVSVLCYLLHITFIGRNPVIQYGADLVASFYFLYLCFSINDKRFSLLPDNNPVIRNSWTQLSHSVAVSLMKIQICIIYFYAGISKLKGGRWWDGSAIWDVFTMEGLVRWDLSFIAYFPHLLVVICYATLLWEIYFPVLIWTKMFRLPLIMGGVLMHICFGLLINIPNFGLLIVSIYILFLRKSEIEWIMDLVKNVARRLLPNRVYSLLNSN